MTGAQTAFCTRCGSPSAGGNFCAHCGAPYRKPAATPVAAGDRALRDLVLLAGFAIIALVQVLFGIGAALRLIDVLDHANAFDHDFTLAVAYLTFAAAVVACVAVGLISVGWTRGKDQRSGLIRLGLLVLVLASIAQAAQGAVAATDLGRLGVPGFPGLTIPGQSAAVTSLSLAGAASLIAGIAFATAATAFRHGSWDGLRRQRDARIGAALGAYTIYEIVVVGSIIALLISFHQTHQPSSWAVLGLIGRLIGALAATTATVTLLLHATEDSTEDALRRRDGRIAVAAGLMTIAVLLLGISAADNSSHSDYIGLSRAGDWIQTSGAIVQIVGALAIAVAFGLTGFRRSAPDATP